MMGYVMDDLSHHLQPPTMLMIGTSEMALNQAVREGLPTG